MSRIKGSDFQMGPVLCAEHATDCDAQHDCKGTSERLQPPVHHVKAAPVEYIDVDQEG